MTNKITLIYSEDFRENNISKRVYGKLRDAGFDPKSVNVVYEVRIGVFRVDYNFDEKQTLPIDSRLEEMLKELNLTGVEVSSAKDWLSVVAK